MRLQELINEYYDVDDVDKIDYPDNNFDSGEVLGQGYFSAVQTIKDNPHDVEKLSHPGRDIMSNPNDADGYVAFIRGLANDKNMQDNIHMPKIRNASIDSKDRIHANIETLVPLTDLSLRELYEMVKRYFPNEPSLESFRQQVRILRGPGPYDSIGKNVNKLPQREISHLRQVLISGLGSRIRYMMSQLHDQKIGAVRNITLPEDEALAQALKWIYKLSDRVGFRIDLNNNNIMARRTPYGLVPVISDPLSFPSEHRVRGTVGEPVKA